jgi:hypothetical protein
LEKALPLIKHTRASLSVESIVHGSANSDFVAKSTQLILCLDNETASVGKVLNSLTKRRWDSRQVWHLSSEETVLQIRKMVPSLLLLLNHGKTPERIEAVAGHVNGTPDISWLTMRLDIAMNFVDLVAISDVGTPIHADLLHTAAMIIASKVTWDEVLRAAAAWEGIGERVSVHLATIRNDGSHIAAHSVSDYSVAHIVDVVVIFCF